MSHNTLEGMMEKRVLGGEAIAPVRDVDRVK
jgi:hypothetical protein